MSNYTGSGRHQWRRNAVFRCHSREQVCVFAIRVTVLTEAQPHLPEFAECKEINYILFVCVFFAVKSQMYYLFVNVTRCVLSFFPSFFPGDATPGIFPYLLNPYPMYRIFVHSFMYLSVFHKVTQNSPPPVNISSLATHRVRPSSLVAPWRGLT